MDKIEFYISLVRKYGPAVGSVIFNVGLNVWLYFINPWLKKRKGHYVSYHTMNGKIGSLELENKGRDGRLDRIEEKIFAHGASLLERERKFEDIVLEQKRFDRSLEEMKYMMRDFIATQKTTNRLLGENKDAMRELLAYLKKQNGA